MPVNSRIMYGMITDKIEERTQASKTIIDTIAKDVINRKQNSGKIGKKHFTLLMHNFAESS